MDTNRENEKEMQENQAVNSPSGQPAQGGGEEFSTETLSESSGGELTPEELLKRQQDEFKAALAEKEDRYLRLAAELDNFKKRMARQFETTAIATREETLTPLLEVIDNVERALAAARQASDLDSLKKGMELIYQQLGGYLQKTGVEKIPAVGQPFDPNLHEAMLQVDSDQYADGIVVQELTPGYRINGRVLRHSRVAVSRGKGEGTVAPGESHSND